MCVIIISNTDSQSQTFIYCPRNDFILKIIIIRDFVYTWMLMILSYLSTRNKRLYVSPTYSTFCFFLRDRFILEQLLVYFWTVCVMWEQQRLNRSGELVSYYYHSDVILKFEITLLNNTSLYRMCYVRVCCFIEILWQKLIFSGNQKRKLICFLTAFVVLQLWAWEWLSNFSNFSILPS